ncbi:S-adenosyl-L-methionine-dependent methyltransferase [Powellomyces hirtus]|nr:S-adenosyl-L-methionine-dependent methyltransferase [Powellomyces hirtus]
MDEEVPPTMSLSDNFPEPFLAFLRSNSLSLSEYALTSPLPRYIRLNPRSTPRIDIPTLALQLGTPLTPVAWLPPTSGFYALAASTRIATCPAYKQRQIYGVDVASGVAVLALDVQPGDHVLDLCCAPGMKLCHVADLQGEEGTGSVTGVDVNPERIAVCRNMLKKYRVQRGRLFVADGTTFDVHAPSELDHRMASRSTPPTEPQSTDPSSAGQHPDGPLSTTTANDKCSEPEATLSPSTTSPTHLSPQSEPEMTTTAPRTIPAASPPHPCSSSSSSSCPSPPRKKPKLKPFHATRLLRTDPQLSHPAHLYDKVLVDAECTHDGSIAHLVKYDRAGWANLVLPNNNNNVLSHLDPAQLWTLQRGLLANGFRLLKPGGILVYATCSFTVRQNEAVVADFLNANEGNVVVEHVPGAHAFPLAKRVEMYDGVQGMQHVLRFSPTASNTSGLFIARFRKTAA